MKIELKHKSPNKRLPNYELLRIFAFLLIGMMHGIRSAYGHSFYFVGMNTVGNMGVTLFVLISGYLGIKLRASKVIWLWSTILFYSFLIFVVEYYPSEISGFSFTPQFAKHLYTAITPITSNTWWFCTSYFIIMLLSPIFNKVADTLTKLQFQYLIAILLLAYSISPTFLLHSLSNTLNGKCTENMILIYFIGRYFAKFGIPQFIRTNGLPIFLTCITIIFCVNYYIFDPLFWAKDHCLFIILGAVCIFNYFCNLRIYSHNVTLVIRYLASFVFPAYLMNIFLISHLEYQYCNLCGWEYAKGFFIVQAEVIGITFIVEIARRYLLERVIRKSSFYFDQKVEYLKKKNPHDFFLNFF